MAYQGEERRKHERAEIRLKTRLWLNEDEGDREIEFEGYAFTRDLAIGGISVDADYLLPVGYPLNVEIGVDDDQVIEARGRIIHRIEATGGGRQTGMGIAFTEVDSANRERLLRFFVSDRIKSFYDDRFILEFPHLEQSLTLKDVALVINLWEDKAARTTSFRHPGGADAKRARLEEAEARGHRGRLSV